MDDWFGWALVVGGLIGFGSFAWLSNRPSGTPRRPSGGTAAFGVIDDLFHPTAKETRVVQEERALAVHPMPSPEDQPFDGRNIVIVVPPESAD